MAGRVDPGTHELTAKVPCWGIDGELSPQARVSQRRAFLLAASGTWMEKLGSGQLIDRGTRAYLM